MGLFDELKKLTRPYDEDDEEFFDEAEETAPESQREEAPAHPVAPAQERKSSFSSAYAEFESKTAPVQSAQPRRDNKVMNINTTAQLKVVLVKPERFETAAEIADHLRDKRTVVMNLEQTNKDVARRLIDFLSGVAYAQEGKIKKVAVSTYIITPYNVDIMGDLIDELESNGLYF
jgi:cell division inhibitor SepF